jgi:hypothetical protein
MGDFPIGRRVPESTVGTRFVIRFGLAALDLGLLFEVSIFGIRIFLSGELVYGAANFQLWFVLVVWASDFEIV